MEIRNHSVMGVSLYWRGKNDPHVEIRLLGEDDEHWWATDVCFSSSWLDDYIKVLQDAKAMLEKSPNFTPDMYNGIQYGFKFTDNEHQVHCEVEGR
jgi:hypothetical protein